MTFPQMSALLSALRIPVAILLAAAILPALADELPNPYPRAVFVGEPLLRWDFAADTEGWRAVNQCELAARDGLLTIRSSGIDPYLAAPAIASGNEFIVRLRMKSQTDGAGQIFWSSTKHAGTAAERVVTFRMTHDGQWHEYDVRLVIDGDLTALRLDPGMAPGEVQIDWIAVHRGGMHPLELAAVEQTAGAVNVRLKNHGDRTLDVTVNGSPHTLAASSDLEIPLPVAGQRSLAAMPIQVESAGLPPIARTVWVHRADAPIDAVTQNAGDLVIEAARDGSEVRVRRSGQLVAAFAPLVHVGDALPRLKLVQNAWPLRFDGDGVLRESGRNPGRRLVRQDRRGTDGRRPRGPHLRRSGARLVRGRRVSGPG